MASSDDRRLDGRVAVITGGASGIGAATAERFSAAGAHVVICDLDEAAGKELAGRSPESIRFVAADVSDAESLATVFADAVDAFGGIDIVFNNAGVGGGEGSIVDCDEAWFDRTIAVDLKGVWLGIKLGTPHLIARGGGSIISTASISGLRGMPGQGAYAAAKSGVIGLTRVAAMELAPHRIRVNAICPGGIVTPIIYRNPALAEPLDPDLVRMGMATLQPIQRAGEPSDIANAALWLASDESSFVTGQSIVVDGGMCAEFDPRMRGALAEEDILARMGAEG